MFINKLERILTDHRHSKRKFIISKYTYEDVYRLAADIRNSLKSINGTICLCTEDRGIIAAALLASLDSDLTMVLPYAFSEQAIREVHQVVRFKMAVTDQPEKLPPEFDAMVPNSNCTVDPSFPRITSPNSVFLKFYTGGSTPGAH